MWVLGNHRVLALNLWSSQRFGWAFVQDKRAQWEVVGEAKNKLSPLKFNRPLTQVHIFSHFDAAAQIGTRSPHFKVIKSRTVR